MKTKRILIGCAILMLAALACQLGNAPIISSQSNTPPTPVPTLPSTQQPPLQVQAPNNPAVQQDALMTLYQQTIPGVVTVLVNTSQGEALGSGFVLDGQGHIVTNDHVVEGAQNNKVEVDFNSGFKTYGTVIGTDPDSDLAIIKVDAPASELHPIPVGDSGALKVGETVVAIGNPFGESGTMTVGVVSGLTRTVQSLHAVTGTSGQTFPAGDFIQTDAAINAGNSGGPLLNLNGEVVGIVESDATNSFTPSGGPVSSGVGFAVSSDILKRVAPLLISNGKVDYPYLGISFYSNSLSSGLTLDVIQALGLTQDTGAYVTEVVPGGPADQAGIKAGTQPTSIQDLNAGGDLITAIDGHPVMQFDDLLAYLVENKSPGDAVVLTVLRGTQKQDITVTLGKRP
ncbi:MAG TPA: trypsin-like peptidase domain-containing protein [Anaerolineales bacterium]|nr:trypsin-like peptidase domain-containing protein [Anaerolineales bacterium]